MFDFDVIRGSFLSSKVKKCWFFQCPILDFNYYHIESFVHLTEKLVWTKVSTFLHIVETRSFKFLAILTFFQEVEKMTFKKMSITTAIYLEVWIIINADLLSFWSKIFRLLVPLMIYRLFSSEPFDKFQ